MQIIKPTNLLVRFLLELCMLIALGYWGFSRAETGLLRFVLGIGCPLLAAVVWGFWLAPASSRRLVEPWRSLAELILFGIASIALYRAGQPGVAAAFVLIYLLNKILIILWKQDQKITKKSF
jgi:hypothetical protein